jgi:hypothetical protein
MSCPRSVRVGPYDIAVIAETATWAAANAKFGEFSAIEQVIRFDGEMPSAAKMLDTVVHEIFHAIFWAYGIEDEDKEERTVSSMATGWAAFMRDNLAFNTWMMGVVARLQDRG